MFFQTAAPFAPEWPRANAPRDAGQHDALTQMLGGVGAAMRADYALLKALTGHTPVAFRWQSPLWHAETLQEPDLLPSAAVHPVRQFPLEAMPGSPWLGSFGRRAGASPFTAQEVRFGGQMVESLRHGLALWLHSQAAERRAAQLEEVVHANENGLIILDANGQIVFSNQRATGMLDSGAGLMRLRGGVSATNFRDAARIHAAIAYVLRQAEGTESQAPVISLPRPKGPSLFVAVLALKGGSGDDSAAVALWIVDSTADISRGVELACDLHGLTRAEARLARQLVSGMTLQAAAAAVDIRDQTARAYLRQIFNKLNVSRQAELVRVLLAGAVRLQAPLISLPR